jgi:hypothetical protein
LRWRAAAIAGDDVVKVPPREVDPELPAGHEADPLRRGGKARDRDGARGCASRLPAGGRVRRIRRNGVGWCRGWSPRAVTPPSPPSDV